MPPLRTHSTPRMDEDWSLKIEIPEFYGTTSYPDVFLEWESSTERYFEFKDTSVEK